MDSNQPIRTGDLIYFPIGEIPSDTIAQHDNVIAIGEGKNHFHKLRGLGQVLIPQHEMKVLLDDHEEDVFRFLRVEQESTLTHELKNGKQANHNPLQIPKGNWAVLRERENDIFTEEVKVVTD